jgi:hypothetical protein
VPDAAASGFDRVLDVREDAAPGLLDDIKKKLGSQPSFS